VFADFDVRPAHPAVGQAVAETRGKIEAPEDVIEQTVHFAMQRQERARFLGASNGEVVAAIPWNKILDSHFISPVRGTVRSRSCRGR